MKRIKRVVWIAVIALVLMGCDNQKGPQQKGEFRLSSESFGTTSYYLLGYLFEDSEFYRFRYQGDKIPDIINEGYRVLGEKE
jgi:uncharacterized lipoprotein NlpE involved in copper resistance